MSDQPAPLDIQKISDLELAELLTQQLTTLFQTQQNVTALQAELQRRKAIHAEHGVGMDDRKEPQP